MRDYLDYYRDKPCSDNPDEINVRAARKLVGCREYTIIDLIKVHAYYRCNEYFYGDGGIWITVCLN